MPEMAGAHTAHDHSRQTGQLQHLPAPLKGTNDVGRTHHTETQIVVAVVRSVVVAVRSARIVLIIVPGAAAHNPAVRFQRPHRC